MLIIKDIYITLIVLVICQNLFAGENFYDFINKDKAFFSSNDPSVGIMIQNYSYKAKSTFYNEENAQNKISTEQEDVVVTLKGSYQFKQYWEIHLYGETSYIQTNQVISGGFYSDTNSSYGIYDLVLGARKEFNLWESVLLNVGSELQLPFEEKKYNELIDSLNQSTGRTSLMPFIGLTWIKERMRLGFNFKKQFKVFESTPSVQYKNVDSSNTSSSGREVQALTTWVEYSLNSMINLKGKLSFLEISKGNETISIKDYDASQETVYIEESNVDYQKYQFSKISFLPQFQFETYLITPEISYFKMLNQSDIASLDRFDGIGFSLMLETKF